MIINKICQCFTSNLDIHNKLIQEVAMRMFQFQLAVCTKSGREQHPHAAHPSFRAPRCESSLDMNEPLSRPFNGPLCLGEKSPFSRPRTYKWLPRCRGGPYFPAVDSFVTLTAFPFLDCTLAEKNKESTRSSTVNVTMCAGARRRQSDACRHLVPVTVPILPCNSRISCGTQLTPVSQNRWTSTTAAVESFNFKGFSVFQTCLYVDKMCSV